MAKVLVLAAGSFIGRHLLEALDGHEVIGTSSREIDFPAGDVCDLRDAAQVSQVIARHRPDWIVQCAGATRTRDPRELYALHVLGSEHLLRAVHHHAPEAVITFFGSAAEYGSTTDLPVSETAPTDPASFFGASKLAQTQLVRAACAEWQLRALVVRPSNVIGPGLGDQYLAAALAGRIRKLLENGEHDLAIVNGTATRDFVDARDVARAVHLLLEMAAPERGQCEVYNVSTGHETPVLEIGRMLAETAGRGLLRVRDAGAADARSGVDRSACDPGKIHAATGWQAKIPVAQSLADMVDRAPRP